MSNLAAISALVIPRSIADRLSGSGHA